VALKDDKNLTPKALSEKTIKLERQIEALDCVAAIKKSDVVLDIGAFIGDTALIFCEKSSLVLAFEPQPDAFECLCINSPRSINFNLAVGNGEGMVCGTDTIDGNMGTRAMQRREEGDRSLRIDQLRLGRVDFVKIDAEGSEVSVLKGMVDTIRRCHPKLLIEVYPQMLERQGVTRAELESVLRDVGYEWAPVIGNETEPRWDILAVPARKSS